MFQKHNKWITKFVNLINKDVFRGIRYQIPTESHQGGFFAPAINQVQKQVFNMLLLNSSDCR